METRLDGPDFALSITPLLEPLNQFFFDRGPEVDEEIEFLKGTLQQLCVVGSLVQKTEEELAKGLSEDTLRRIKEYLSENGLELGMEFNDKVNGFLYAYVLLIYSYVDKNEDSIDKMIGRMQGEEPEKQEEGVSVIAAQSKGRRAGICPHCDKPIEVIVKTTVEGVGIPAQLREELGWRYRAFLKTAVLKMLPPFARRHFSEEFGTTDIKLWSAQGIGVVTADDIIRVFIPTDMLMQKSTSTIDGKVQATLEPNPEEFAGWIRTKFGYVVGKGEAFENMRKKSIGEFARPRV